LMARNPAHVGGVFVFGAVDVTPVLDLRGTLLNFV
jgi:hypothetical protein